MSPIADWGAMIRDLQACGYSLRLIREVSGWSGSSLHRALTDPRYQPRHDRGERLRVLHETRWRPPTPL